MTATPGLAQDAL